MNEMTRRAALAGMVGGVAGCGGSGMAGNAMSSSDIKNLVREAISACHVWEHALVSLLASM